MARASLVVEPLPVVVASGLVGNLGLEIGLGGFRVVVHVVLAVVPVVPLVRITFRGLRLVRWIPALHFRGDKLRGNDSDSV